MNKKIILGLTVAIVIGAAGATYAATNEGLGLGRITGKKGYEYSKEIATKNYNISPEELDKAREEGKTTHEYLEEKGIKEEEFEKAMKDSKKEAVDKAVVEGKITKEEGDKIKAAIDSNESRGPKNVNSNEGNMGQGKGMGQGNGMGQGKNLENDNCINN